MSAISFIRRVWNRAFVELDLLSWRRGTAQIRNTRPPQAEKTVLFCDLMVLLSTAKVEALFAAILAQRACRSVILLQRKSPIVERAFLACGSVQFLYLDELLNSEIVADAEIIAESYLSHSPNLEALTNLEIDGFRTGRNALSRVVRKFRIGRLDRASSAQMRELRNILVESIAVSRVANILLNKLQPELAVFLEKGYTPAGEVYDACLLRGIDTVQWLSAPQSDYLLFKRYSLATRAEHPFALGLDTWEQLRKAQWTSAQDQLVVDRIVSHYQSGAWYNRQQLQTGKYIVPPAEVRSRLGVRPGRKVAVIFAHILYDATFFYGDSLYPDYEQWLIETVRGAIANPKMDWVIKVHPVNVWRSRMDGVPMEQIEAKVLQREFGSLPPHVSLMPADTEINTYSLFETIDFGLTVRGTIGMELPCFGVPVVTAGTGRYSGHGFTIDPESREAYQAILSKLHEYAPLNDEQKCRARQYAYGAFFLRPFPTESFRLNFHARSFGAPPLAHNVELSQIHLSRWPDIPDLQRIAEWALDSSRSDLMVTESNNSHKTMFAKYNKKTNQQLGIY